MQTASDHEPEATRILFDARDDAGAVRVTEPGRGLLPPPPRRAVWLAGGKAEPDSDIDLLVILDDNAPAEHLTLRAGWESRRGYDRAVDVIPVREAVYQRRSKIAGTLAYEAEIDGIAVYEQA